MNAPTQLPLPLDRCWPIGLRLRFKLDAAMKPRYRYLRGTPALVLDGLQYCAEDNDWRQYVAAFGGRAGEEFGWALPGQLELIPGESDDPALQLGEELRRPGRAGVPSPSPEFCRML